MNEVEEKLVHFVLNEDISAIQIMSRRLGISQDEVRVLLDNLIGDGILVGYISKDGQRFFRHDLKQPHKESKARDDYVPDYGAFDTRPWIILSIVGLIILGISVVFYTTSNPEIAMESSIGMFIGLALVLIGCYCVSMRRSPI
jgi:hypothetical protein